MLIENKKDVFIPRYRVPRQANSEKEREADPGRPQFEIVKQVANQLLNDEKFKEAGILAINLYGSLIRYDSKKKRNVAEKDSDLDMFIFFDANKIEHKYTNKNEVLFGIKKIFREQLANTHEFTNETIKEMVKHIGLRTINLKIIDNALKNIGDKKVHFDYVYKEKLAMMFILSIGTGLNKYRKYLLIKLKTMGKKGESIWKKIIGELKKFENYRREDGEKIPKYPETIDDAIKMYLK